MIRKFNSTMLLLVGLLATVSLQAQVLYEFSVSTDTYNDLEGTTSLTNGELWDDPEYSAPIGFPFAITEETTETLHFVGLGGMLGAVDYYSQGDFVDWLMPFQADIIDRAYNMNDSLGVSNISYKLEGQPGAQIFKMEWNNVGFFSDEEAQDYVNFQLWLYEASNDFEVRIGASSVLNPESYEGIAGPAIGLTTVNNNSYDFTNVHFLEGDTNNPTFVNEFAYTYGAYFPYLQGTPANGTVYRFSRVLVGIDAPTINASEVTVFPNPSTDYVTVNVSKVGAKVQSVQLINGLGQLVQEQANTTNGILTFDTHKLPQGVYMVQIVTDTKAVVVKQVVKQ